MRLKNTAQQTKWTWY